MCTYMPHMNTNTNTHVFHCRSYPVHCRYGAETAGLLRTGGCHWWGWLWICVCWHLQTEWRYSERMDMYHIYCMHWFIQLCTITMYVYIYCIIHMHYLFVLQVAIKIIPKSKVFSWSKVRKFACSLHEWTVMYVFIRTCTCICIRTSVGLYIRVCVHVCALHGGGERLKTSH